MAKATPILIEAIRNTAKKLETGAPYQWGHMGSCNCGNLAQEITDLSEKEIIVKTPNKAINHLHNERQCKQSLSV